MFLEDSCFVWILHTGNVIHIPEAGFMPLSRSTAIDGKKQFTFKGSSKRVGCDNVHLVKNPECKHNFCSFTRNLHSVLLHFLDYSSENSTQGLQHPSTLKSFLYIPLAFSLD